MGTASSQSLEASSQLMRPNEGQGLMGEGHDWGNPGADPRTDSGV